MDITDSKENLEFHELNLEQPELSYDEILIDLGFGKFQIILLLISSLTSINLGIQNGILFFLQEPIVQDFQVTGNWKIFWGFSEYFGDLIGSLLVGYLSDKYGRKKTIFFSSIGLLIFNTLFAFSQNYLMLVLCRFVCGIFLYLNYLVGYMYFFEFCHQKVRGRISFFPIFCSLGRVILILLMHCFMKNFNQGSWRIIVIVLDIILIFIMISFYFADESVRFFVLTQQFEKAYGIINKMAKKNKNIENYLNESRKKAFYNWSQSFLSSWNYENSNKYSFRNIFYSEYKIITPLLLFYWSSLTFKSFQVFFDSTNLFTKLHQSKSSNILNLLFIPFLQTIGAVLGTIMINSKFFGRKKTLHIFNIGFSITVVLFCLQVSNEISVFLGFLGCFNQICSNIKFLLTNELYPTTLRATAFGFCNMFGRIGTMLVPLVCVPVSQVDVLMPFAISGVLSIVSTLVIIRIPETMDRELELFKEDIPK